MSNATEVRPSEGPIVLVSTEPGVPQPVWMRPGDRWQRQDGDFTMTEDGTLVRTAYLALQRQDPDLAEIWADEFGVSE